MRAHYPSREVCSNYSRWGNVGKRSILKRLYFPAGLRNNANDKQEMRGGQVLQSRPMPIKGLQQQKRAAKSNVCTLPRKLGECLLTQS